MLGTVVAAQSSIPADTVVAATQFTLSSDAVVAITAVIAVVLSIVNIIYAISSNTTRYELTEDYRRELMGWYSDVSEVLMTIIQYTKYGRFYAPEFREQKEALLAKLSALIEVGRFYFPNVILDDDHGKSKPSAYQGHRDIMLEHLVQFFNLAEQVTEESQYDALWNLEYQYTSELFDIIAPRKRNEKYVKMLDINRPEDRVREDYIARVSAEQASIKATTSANKE